MLLQGGMGFRFWFLFQCGWRGWFDVIGQWDIPRCTEVADIRAVFVFNAEESPYASTAYFREADKEADESGVLEFLGVDRVEDPIEAEYRVDNHGQVIYPRAFVAEDVAKKGILGIGVAET